MHNGKAGYGRDGDDGGSAPFTLDREKARAPEQYLGQRAEDGESKGGQHLSHRRGFIIAARNLRITNPRRDGHRTISLALNFDHQVNALRATA